jgi:predicted nucleic acid-binding protein
MYLLDTNIFLEILLGQDKKEACKKFIITNGKDCCVSDFTVYSIGIVLFKKKLFDDYKNFFIDISSFMKIISLPHAEHIQLSTEAKSLKLDFDDLYQYQVAKNNNLSLVTMDNDFKVIRDVEIIFL